MERHFVTRTTWLDGDETGDTETTERYAGPMSKAEAEQKAASLNKERGRKDDVFGVMKD
jgi:hypothetical protein